jgi:thioredoxin reductase
MDEMVDVAVIGAGPAGVSCSIWLKQLGFSALVVEKNDRCGGLQLLNPNLNPWIATSAGVFGKDLAATMHQNMVAQGIPMRMGTIASSASSTPGGFAIDLSNGERLNSKLLVLAGGVKPRTGGLINRAGLIIGPGHPVAKTDFRGSNVAILGGGDSAFEYHRYILGKGASKATIFARSIKARAELIAPVPPTDVFVGEYAVDPEKNTVDGKSFDQIVVLYGFGVDNQSLLGLELAMKPNGLVATDNDCQTSIDGIYAIGEIAGRMHPCCVTSMADGVIAAKAIQRRLESTAISKYSGMARRAAGLLGQAL